MITKSRRQVRLMADYGTAGVWDHDGTALDLAKVSPQPAATRTAGALVRPVSGVVRP